jgi:hypothetical protein
MSTPIKKQKLPQKSLGQKVAHFRNEQPRSITFIKQDNSNVIQRVNEKFFETHRGRKKSVKQLTDDLLSIQHDLGAKYFIL